MSLVKSLNVVAREEVEGHDATAVSNAALDQLKKDIAEDYGFSMTECRVELDISPDDRRLHEEPLL